MSSLKSRSLCLPTLGVALALFGPAAAWADDDSVLISCTRPCNEAAAAIRSVGGRVTRQFDNIDAISGSIPSGTARRLSGMLAGGKVIKDELVPAPRPAASIDLSSQVAQSQVYGVDNAALQSIASANPNSYAFNTVGNGAATLHAQGNLGQDVIVAIIDSGTANWPGVVTLVGSVIGGESVVPGAAEPSATSRANNPHGTFVGNMIAAHGLLGFTNTSRLVQSLNTHAPGNSIPCPNAIAPGCPAGVTLIPVIGTAPAAKLYAIKAFPAAGGGAPVSQIVAAMDRAITLRRNYNRGMPSIPVRGDGSENNPFVYDSLKIDIVNMSLGGPTLFAGRDLEDQLTREMLKVGITVVVAAGNDGFPAMTVSSPGTGLGSLTVGATNDMVHERVLRDVQFGLGIGALYHASAHLQTADFSGRGPNADGRRDPDLVANGYANIAQVANGGVSIGSGTS